MLKKALNYLFNPCKWYYLVEWKNTEILENDLLKYLWNNWKIFSFYNWRSAIYHWIKSLSIWNGDEIILQAFTCVSVPNSIIQTWATPIYCDIDPSDLNIDPNKIENLITPKTKAILVQHTFWIPCKIYDILNICKKYNLFLIEDCAHSIWAKINWIKVWNFGDIAIFSFGRDKIISSVNWWFLIINNKKINIYDWFKLYDLPFILILKNLFYIIVSYLSYKLYDFFWLWKFIIFISRKINLIPEVLSNSEKRCCDSTFNYKLPNCIADIWISEFKKIDIYNNHRINISNLYNSSINNVFKNLDNSIYPVYLRYPFLVKNQKKFIRFCKNKKILIWDWYHNIIDPSGTDLNLCWYVIWSCIVAEKISSMIVNLPNHMDISIHDYNRVIKNIKDTNFE